MIPVQNVQAEEPNLRLYAKAAVLMDADSGRVLYAGIISIVGSLL